MSKKRILLLIDNLKKGGAEVLLAGILKELNTRFEIILVTLTGECEFNQDEIVYFKRYNLGFSNRLSFIISVFKLKKIIKIHKPSLVHSHLVFSSLIARFACPSKIPLIFSIHNELSKNVFNESSLLYLLERISKRKRNIIIAVSEAVLNDYEKTIGPTNKMYILKNYIGDQFFSNNFILKKTDFNEIIKMVAIGNIKNSKNYEYLLTSMIHLKNYPVSLDIYGNTNHPSFTKLQSLIEGNQLPVKFAGITSNVQETLSKYDWYVMSSSHEGFGIAAIEAMACGLPLLLSDLPVLKEVTYNNAVFFNTEDPVSLSRLIKKIIEEKNDLHSFSIKGIEIAKQYSKQNYLEKLFSIYDETAQ